MGFFYIILTIVFTVYGQIVVKWQVTIAGNLPEALEDKLIFFTRLIMNPWIISSFIAAFFAALSWMAAMTKYELSYAYPFMSASFVLVFIFSTLLFHEQITGYKIVGLAMIVMGIIVSSR